MARYIVSGSTSRTSTSTVPSLCLLLATALRRQSKQRRNNERRQVSFSSAILLTTNAHIKTITDLCCNKSEVRKDDDKSLMIAWQNAAAALFPHRVWRVSPSSRNLIPTAFYASTQFAQIITTVNIYNNANIDLFVVSRVRRSPPAVVCSEWVIQ